MCSTEKKFDEYEEYLTKYLQNTKDLALLLDYDGTLSPLVAHPDLAVIPPKTKEILQKLAQVPQIFVGIISGRAVDNVKHLVGLDTITYAGNHGLEVIYPDGKRYNHQLPTNFEEDVKKMIQKLEQSVVRDGAWIENKGPSLTYHYRAAPTEKKEELAKTARKIMEEANFKIVPAHEAIEARPKVDWNKGKVAVMLLEQKYGKQWRKNVKVVFAGDDTTDEDAMEALKGYAATFRIARTCDIKTHAEKLLSSTEHVVKILEIISKCFVK
ncbi:unnamed protein product [Acanthoscelides obtectus]|uniref:Trehalose 6-phosphate phosphatase n=1 Tax=Acanthoscelides obtectus TaxID=200917 RepID=A0A9P0JIC1_ACAOB|nr:unnamed protein product [Acanthoscelides obtectus]CAK1678454.1 Probable trehalose-phosphate phosphatase J [Acanthoscelides obtectus]